MYYERTFLFIFSYKYEKSKILLHLIVKFVEIRKGFYPQTLSNVFCIGFLDR